MDIFCKIVNKEMPSEIFYEDDYVVAFNDINPRRPGHFLVVPKEHSTNLKDISDEILTKAIIVAKTLAKKRIKELGVPGFNLIINNEKEANQVIFHTHIHIIPSE